MKARPILWLTLILDVLAIALLKIAGWKWFAAVFLPEFLFWMLRLYWLSRPLFQFIRRRLLHMVPVIFSVLVLSFFLIQLAPGDIFTQMALNPDIRPDTLESFRKGFGLDQPWYVQFFRYMWNALHGDFGYSELYKAPVFTLVAQRAWNTLILAVLALVIAWGFSVPAGVIMATKQYRWQDQILSVFAFAGLSLPSFFVAFLIIYILTNTGSWLPIGGMHDIDVDKLSSIGKALDLGKHLIVPVFVLTLAPSARLTRIMRANMLDVLGQQYVTTARAKGLRERVVVYRHALRNAINPMITIFGFQLGALLGGSALVEVVLSWPGLGKLILSAVMAQDTFLVMGSLTYGVALLVIGNLVADVLLALVDPRVRLR
jgi:peptide/nickel transport system permease protein